ncbi:hypothetical protein NDU88_001311 [Pleurodeles waltl]|uniref:Uncharacterized protein n=1 Tax=Pleurodeles waltl TaxID=8319 RepID=A0AAV7L9E5_PLEWA|nr:hypothetical protein NDU88_001311 [Pleurodeles waltl]
MLLGTCGQARLTVASGWLEMASKVVRAPKAPQDSRLAAYPQAVADERADLGGVAADAAGFTCLSQLLVTCGRARLTVASGWFVMAAKVVRTPKAAQVSRGKPGLATSMERRDQKHLPCTANNLSQRVANKMAEWLADGETAVTGKWAVTGGW